MPVDKLQHEKVEIHISINYIKILTQMAAAHIHVNKQGLWHTIQFLIMINLFGVRCGATCKLSMSVNL